MSEFESFDFRENSDPELDAILYGFTNNAYQYYNWVENTVSHQRLVLGYSIEMIRKMRPVSVAFAEAAVSIDRYFEDTLRTRQLLTKVWFRDEQYRNNRFSTLVSGNPFNYYGEQRIERKIKDIQEDADNDIAELFGGVLEEYGGSLELDVHRLLGRLHVSEEAALNAKLADMPLSTSESYHESLQFGRAEELSKETGRYILSLLEDGKFVRYQHHDE